MIYDVRDDFLDADDFNRILEVINSEGEVPWYHSAYQVKEDGMYFYHILYRNNRPRSSMFELFEDTVLKKMKVNSMVDARINLYITKHSKTMATHQDNHTYDMNHKTSIFYLDTNNGKTVLVDNDKEIKIDSRANRLVTFPAATDHYAIQQTDTSLRTIVNFNYY